MIGVIFVRELSRAGRGRLTHYARWIYVGWLTLVLYFYHAAYYADYLFLSPVGTFPAGATADFAHRLVDFLVFQQTMVVLLTGPSFAAGAITDEKVRGTLEPLFLAHLTPMGIILGKMLARVAQGALWSLAAWPVIAFVGYPGGVTPMFFVCLAVITVFMLTGASAVSMLVSVWSRTTRDAVVIIYVLMALVMVLVLLARSASPKWEAIASLDPNYVLDAARDAPDYGVLGRRLRMTTLMWGSMTVISTAIAAWRLRPAYIKQQSRRRYRWVTAISFRPPMGDRPIVWKEQFSTRMPRWLGLVITGAISVVAMILLLVNAPATMVVSVLVARCYLGFVFLVALAAGVRASGAIVSERERRTWDCLASTPYDFQRIVADKVTGICMGIWPYYFAVVIPAAAVYSIANFDQIISAMPPATQLRSKGVFDLIAGYAPRIAWLLMGPGLTLGGFIGLAVLLHRGFRLPWYPVCAGVIALAAAANCGWIAIIVPLGVVIAAAMMTFMAGVGIWISAHAHNTWLSMLGTVLVGPFAFVVVGGASCPLGCLTLVLGFALASGTKEFLGPDGFYIFDSLWPLLLVMGMLLGLWWAGVLFAQWAAKHLEETDRVPGNDVRNIELDQPYAKAED
jgi:ABC-type transport system involved in multi-copper enzyme maturation permease subunit